MRWYEKKLREIERGRSLPLVLESEAGSLDGRVAVVGMTEVMTTDSGELTQEHMVAPRMTAGHVLVPGHDNPGCGVACAYGVEVGRAAAVAVSGTAQGVAAGVAIAAAVGEDTGVAVAHTRASPHQALVPPAGGMKHKKR